MIDEVKTIKKYLDEEFYSGRINEEQDFLRFQLAKKFLSRVSIADE